MVLDVPVLRHGQAKVIAQRRARVLPAKQTAPLQYRHHQIDEIVEPLREVAAAPD